MHELFGLRNLREVLIRCPAVLNLEAHIYCEDRTVKTHLLTVKIYKRKAEPYLFTANP